MWETVAAKQTKVQIIMVLIKGRLKPHFALPALKMSEHFNRLVKLPKIS